MTQPVRSRLLVSAAACLLVAGATSWISLLASNESVPPRQPRPAGTWFKGNMHTHSLRSDGDSTPDQVIEWYRNHDYDFLALTDHNVLAPTDALNAKYGADHQFLVIQGEEVTDSYGDQPLHLNALGASQAVEPQHGTSVVDVIQRNVDAIRRRRRCSTDQTPKLHLADWRRGAAPGRARLALRGVQRTSLDEYLREPGRAEHGRSLGSHPLQRKADVRRCG